MNSLTNKYLLSRELTSFDLIETSAVKPKIHHFLIVPVSSSKFDFVPIKTSALQLLKAKERIGSSLVKGFIAKGRNGQTNLYITSFEEE